MHELGGDGDGKGGCVNEEDEERLEGNSEAHMASVGNYSVVVATVEAPQGMGKGGTHCLGCTRTITDPPTSSMRATR